MKFFKYGQVVPDAVNHNDFTQRPETAYDRLHLTTQAFTHGVCSATMTLGAHFHPLATLGLAVVTAGLTMGAIAAAPWAATAVIGGKALAYGAAMLFGGMTGGSLTHAVALGVTRPNHTLSVDHRHNLTAFVGFVAPWALAATTAFNAYGKVDAKLAEVAARPAQIWNVRAKDCKAPEVAEQIAQAARIGIKATCKPQ